MVHWDDDDKKPDKVLKGDDYYFDLHYCSKCNCHYSNICTEHVDKCVRVRTTK